MARVAAPGTGPENGFESGLIEGYELLEELHRGGQGVVYRGVQLGTKRQVAVKVLLEGPFAGAAARRRFEREVELAASLRHPHIVTILESGVSHTRYFFAMEYIAGLRLDRYLAQVRPPLRATLDLFATICEAVNFAHQRGVIHRDLKPPNILVDEAGQPHVLDFGLAKPIRQADPEDPTIAMLSVAGELLGTVAYMSPEQTLGAQEVDLRTDVYSLGVIFYEALLGELPYSADGPLGEVLTRIATAEPHSPRQLRRHSRFARRVDDELATILLKALEKDPARRYQTAGDLGRDLRRLLNGEPIEAKRASGLYMLRKTLKRYRLQASLGVAALLTLILFVVTFAFLWSSEREAKRRAAEDSRTAQQRAIEARAAEDASQRAQAALRRALLSQTLQRGELAQTRGDLVAARDFYWAAYLESEQPAAHWALRQYYLLSGDRGAGVLHVGQAALRSLAPGGDWAALCETPAGITVREVETGRVRAWLRAPGPVRALYIDDAGTVCAAGSGWGRLWPAGAVVPTVAAQVPGDWPVAAVRPASGGSRLLLIGTDRIACYEGGSSAPVGTARLAGRWSGSSEAVALAPGLDRVALALARSIQLVTVRPDGTLDSTTHTIGPVGPRAVQFCGDRLVVVGADGVFQITTDDSGAPSWARLAETPAEWDLVDLSPDAGTAVFALRTGGVAVVSTQSGGPSWHIGVSELQDVRAGADGRVLTLDTRGTITRWAAPGPGAAHRILGRPLLAWAVAEDGSGVLLADERERVIAYAPALSAQPETIAARRRFGLSLGAQPDPPLLALSGRSRRAVVCSGSTIRLRELGDQSVHNALWNSAQTPALRHVALSGDGQFIAFCAQTAASDRQEISFWRWEPLLRTERTVAFDALLPPARAPVTLVGSLVRGAAFKPNTSRLLVARSNGDLLWLDAGQPTASAPAGPPAPAALPERWVHLDAAPLALSFDRRGERVAIACEDLSVLLLSTRDGTTLARLRLPQPARVLDFSAQGDVLLIITADGAVGLYDPVTAERFALLAAAAAPGAREPFSAWLGDVDALLLADGEGVAEHAYAQTDALLAENQKYAELRAVARHLADSDFAAAWRAASGLARFDPALAHGVRATLLEAALQLPGQDVPATWTAAVLAEAPARTYLRLGHAAYDGERFELAGQWLARGRALLDGQVDAYTALRIAQCEYLADHYEQAAEQFAQVVTRPDLDDAHVTTAQLQQVAALVFSGQLDRARAVAVTIGALRVDSPRSDLVAATSARDIARYLTGVATESFLATSVERLLTTFAEDSLLFYDDGRFFSGELARRRGDPQAAAQYQLCIELARDAWPANWARYRLLRLSREVR